MEHLSPDITNYDSLLLWLREELTLGKLWNTLSFNFDSVMDIAVYVFIALAVYTLAKRRNFDKPWLAWIPVAMDWQIGSLADQYQLRVHGKVTTRRKWLLGANCALYGSGILVLVMLLLLLLSVLKAGYNGYDGEYDKLLVWGSLGAVILVCITLCVAAILRTVHFHMALYDIYRSCEPKNAVLYTVLGVIFGFLVPVFLMICKDKDDGMYIPQVPREPWEGNV